MAESLQPFMGFGIRFMDFLESPDHRSRHETHYVWNSVTNNGTWFYTQHITVPTAGCGIKLEHRERCTGMQVYQDNVNTTAVHCTSTSDVRWSYLQVVYYVNSDAV